MASETVQQSWYSQPGRLVRPGSLARKLGVLMNKTLKLLAGLAIAAAAAAGAAPSRAEAAVNVNVQVGLPVAPPMVVVQPGVQVVEDWDEEVYFTSGFYWVRRDDGWYRSRRPNARFVYVERRVVPVALVRMPPGQYVRYKKAKHHRDHDHDGDHGHGRGHGKHGHGKHKHKHHHD